MRTITNTAAGPRGVPLRTGGTFYIEPGATEVLDVDGRIALYGGLTEDALDHDGDGNPGGSKPHNPPGLTGKSKAALIEIAEAEGVELEDDMTVADIRSAIELKREA